MDVRVMLEVTPSELGGLLARGWRRFGASYFRPACPSCTQCISTRIPAGQFVPTRSQRRARRLASKLTRVVSAPVVDDERLALYERWHTQRESRRGWAESPLNAERYAFDFAFAHPSVREVGFRDPANHDRLVGLGIVDVVPGALSAVSFLGSRARAALAWRRAHRVVDRGRGEARARPCVSGLPRGRVPVAGLQGALPSAGVARGAAGAGRCSGVETFRGDWRAGPLTREEPLRSERGDGQGDPADQECHSAEGRDCTEDGDTCQCERVEAAGKNQDPRREAPARDHDGAPFAA